MVTIELLIRCFPTQQMSRLQAFVDPLNIECAVFEINTTTRLAAFLAQVGHESGDLRWLVELWGPTAQQRRYEPPSNLAARLGNDTPGDGSRFRGRGLIQLTGRSNYEQASAALGVDYIGTPELMQHPDHAVKTACWWWQSRGLNELADLDTEDAYRRITRIINGGLTGWHDRLARWRRVKSILNS